MQAAHTTATVAADQKLRRVKDKIRQGHEHLRPLALSLENKIAEVRAAGQHAGAEVTPKRPQLLTQPNDRPRPRRHPHRRTGFYEQRWGALGGPAAARRGRVLARDGYRCTQLLPGGLRCPVTDPLELHPHDGSLTTRCPTHTTATRDRTR